MQELLTNIAENAMESLVAEEIARQLKLYPETRRQAFNLQKTEIAIYALNRLPVLYASSQKELTLQIELAKQNYLEKVRQLVSEGFLALETETATIKIDR
ncbi:MAG: late competence development ComFB family protein [Prochloraceae cyanobacterium]